MDQVKIRAAKKTKSTMVVYADPKSRGYHDLLIKGGQFYAVYDPVTKFWKRGLADLSQLIDHDIDDFLTTYDVPDGMDVIPQYMDSMSNGCWQRYLTSLKGLDDDRTLLDQKILFDNDEIDREDYASFKEEYALKESPIPNYEKIMSTIYTPDERRKLEWGIGMLVDGKHVKRTHKFFVICGDPGTGKSTILHIIEQLFAGYISYFNAKELGQGYTFATASFKNAPLIAIQTDGDLSHLYDNTIINQISGHETIIVNEKGVKQYPVELKTVMFMATNKPVRITDAQSGLIRRLIDVYPSNRTLPNAEYFEAMDGIRFELGGIAWHCLQVYRSMGPNAYGSYVAKEMIARTNDIYSFLSSELDRFEDGAPIEATTLWREFKTWCEEANIDVRMKRDEFIFEVGNYFEKTDRSRVKGRVSSRNATFTDFKWDKFASDGDTSEDQPDIHKIKPLELNSTESKFDALAADYPAQYAADNDIGGPLKRWDDVTTTLKDIDTTKLHWVRVPENHIVLDFDLRGPDGEKSLEENLLAAAQYPPTYAEVSKSGNGVHLHYIYDGDAERLKPLIDEHIECKVYKGRSALRRKLSRCNDLDVAHISSGLPLKGEKTMINKMVLKDEAHIRALIRGNLKKKYQPGTKPSIDFICKILDEAYDSEIQYDVTDMRQDVMNFAMNSTHNAKYCMECVANMKFKSAHEDIPEAEKPTDTSVLTFYDVEVFPNLFMICFKDSDKDHVQTWINPPAKSVQALCTKNLVGFNNRRYDNHILYAWGWLGYSNKGLYDLSQAIVTGQKGCQFPNAYNLSYADIYDFSSKKQSLKKWEIELGIDHHELGMPWDKPVPEDKWPLVQSYCEDDVRATEATFNHLHEDFVARQGLANLSGMTVNDSTNQHTARIIFGDDRHPQSQFPFPDLADTFPGYTFDEYAPRDKKSFYRGEYPGEGGYVWVYGMPNGDGPQYETMEQSWVLDGPTRLKQFEDAYSEIGLSFKEEHPGLADKLDHIPATSSTRANPPVDPEGKVLGGMFGNVALLDIASMHPSSLEDMNFFGPYTKRFSDIKQARIDIKHKNLEAAKTRMDGALAPLLKEGEDTKSLAQALKIVINSVYGLTSAKFPTQFNDVANGMHDRNKDNKVAKRGALFMILLKHKIQELGYTVVHVKTDSVKIADADEFIIAFVNDFGKHYGYIFEHEATYDRMCIVNKSTYIAHSAYGDHMGEWTPTGTQFLHPYVFKTLFSKEPIEFRDLCETKSVKTAIYLDFNEGLPEDEHRYDFVGKVSAFSPVKPGVGGGLLMCERGEGYAAVTGTKGFRWKESSYLRDNHKTDEVDMLYYEELAGDAIDTINKYGDFSWFVDTTYAYVSPNHESNTLLERQVNGNDRQ